MNRTFVLGLDGGTFSVLDRYIDANPDGIFADWIKRGFVRRLRSTKPYFTAPAWTTFMTGLNPGEHGVFHWRARYKRKWRSRPLISTQHLVDCSFWSYVQHEGAQVSVSNFPMEYPAPPTAGAYICGTLAPEDSTGTSWPAQLISQVRQRFPSYRFEMDKGISYMDRLSDLRDHILHLGRDHAGAFEVLCEPQSADFAFHTVTATDRMQHFFWHCVDESHPRYDSQWLKRERNPIFEAYQIGEELAERVWSSGRFDSALIVSDHGAGPSYLSFFCDVWLAEQGLVKFDSTGRVDFDLSIAYSGEEPECSIYVNRIDRDGVGLPIEAHRELVAALSARLAELQRPDLSEPAFDRVYTQDELYSGPFAAEGPDIVLMPSSGVHPQPGSGEKVFAASKRLFCGHRLDGILVGYGRGFERSDDRSSIVEMIEMFPLLCALSGIPVPAGLDGGVPTVLPTLRMSATVDRRRSWRDRVQTGPALQTDRPDLVRRLAEMGYI
jgi:predicted AlkP superfamily phosphohydrolase/phosphomutase